MSKGQRRVARYRHSARRLCGAGQRRTLWGGEGSLALLLSFAGGAVLASLADTLMPNAYREGGAWIAFATTAT